MAKFSEEVIRLAQESEKKYGVPASVTLAQYASESAYGTSPLSQKTNNFFGIKYFGSGTNYYASGGSRWRKYSSMAESFDDHGKLLAGDLYAPHTKNATNVNEYIDAFASIYTKDEGYAKQLKQIINDFDLTQYDSMYKTSVLDSIKNSEAVSDLAGSKVGYWKNSEAVSDLTGSEAVSGIEQEYKWYEAGYWKNILGDIITVIVILAFVVLIFILIMKAFNIPTNKTDLIKKMVSDTEGENND